MAAESFSISQLSEKILGFCAASKDPMVHTAAQWISGFFEIEQLRPQRYGWRFSSTKAVEKQSESAQSPAEINRIFWSDQARNIEAYSAMSVWRGAELIKPAIRSLNVGELIAPAVLARSLLELSTAFLLNANDIGKFFGDIAFPPGTVVGSQEFEERVVKAIWGTRRSGSEQYLQQTNILSLLQRLAKNPNCGDLLPHYEFLCEIAHPNVIGNNRFWSHVERINDDGSEIRTLCRTADGDRGAEIRTKVLWSLAWSAGSLRNSFTMLGNSVRALLSKLNVA